MNSARRRLGSAGMLGLLVTLTACSGGQGIRVEPEDMNVSPRSQEAYDPTFRQLENDPVEDTEDKEQN